MAEGEDSAPDIPSIEVELVDKSEKLPDEDVTHLEIEEDLQEPGMFRISLNDALDQETQNPRWSEETGIQPGNKVKITIGFVSDSDNKTLSFIGLIKSIGIQEGGASGASLELWGYDLAYDLKKKDTSGFIYNDKKYSEIVTELAGNSKLKTDKIEKTTLTYENVTRYPGESDFDFLKKMSGEIGFESFVQEESLYFRKPKDTAKGEITFEKDDILSFSPTMSTAAVLSELTVNSWDVKKKEMISGKATLDDIKSGVRIKEFTTAAKKFKDVKLTLGDRVLRSAEEAKNVAIVELKRRNQGFIEAGLECKGNPELRPGMTVNVEEMGESFNGVYYIERAAHTVGANGYTTNLGLRGCL